MLLEDFPEEQLSGKCRGHHPLREAQREKSRFRACPYVLSTCTTALMLQFSSANLKKDDVNVDFIFSNVVMTIQTDSRPKENLLIDS